MPRGRGQRRQREGWQGAEGHNQHSSSRPRGRSIAQRQAAGARRSHMLVPPGPGAIPGLTKPTTNRFGKKKGRHPDPKPGQASPPSLLQWCWLGLVSVAEHSRSRPTPSVTIQLHSAASPPTQHHSPSPKFPPCPQPHRPGPLLVSQHLCPTARATLSIQHGRCVPPRRWPCHCLSSTLCCPPGSPLPPGAHGPNVQLGLSTAPFPCDPAPWGRADLLLVGPILQPEMFAPCRDCASLGLCHQQPPCLSSPLAPQGGTQLSPGHRGAGGSLHSEALPPGEPPHGHGQLLGFRPWQTLLKKGAGLGTARFPHHIPAPL